MLKLTNITKHYVTGNSTVEALRGVSIEFRKSEFVSILGPSGCGKTTLLNIIGGLDRYTDGDLVINGKSTKTFKDSDWDSYRNHSIGFVFQSYNLIPHQSVLANVELALTLSGVPKAERRRRAKEALEKVGLGDQIHKKPNQMSGGQMQRVAIARALVNDPDILLADEPTGALDTTTSVQVMEILKEISKDRLIIMVTHNPELAETYSTRIIKALDGLVIDDSDPYTAPAEEEKTEVALTKKETKIAKRKEKKARRKAKTSMSFFTALSLSLNNLATKKGRTIMTSFAGSIGIIGIALILSVSSGVNAFIRQVQEDTLSTYPLTIQKHAQDYDAILSAMTDVNDEENYRDTNQIHVDDSLGTMMSAMTSTIDNNVEAFKKYLEKNYDKIKDYVSDIQYTYDYEMQAFNVIYDENGNPIEARKVGLEAVFDHMGEAFSGMSELMSMGGSTINIFSEMINNQDLLDQQYEVVAGNWPKSSNEVVLVINSNNQISKMALYMLGVLDPNEIEEELKNVMSGEYTESNVKPFSYDYFVGMNFKLLTTSDFFVKNPNKTYTVDGKTYNAWDDQRENPVFDLNTFVANNGIELTISGIIRPKEGVAAASISGAIGYTKGLTDYILEKNTQSEVINQQKETPEYNVLTGLKFERTHYTPETIDQLIEKIDDATMEMFYGYMTEQILTNPDFADRIEVKDLESFIGIYMLLPIESRVAVMNSVMEAVTKDGNNALALQALFGLVSGTTDGITITPDNFTTLLPILDVPSVYLSITGITGLCEAAGDEAMAEIYGNLNVTADTFMMTLATLPQDQKAAVLTSIVTKAVENDPTSVATLTQMLSGMTGAEVTNENLAMILTFADTSSLGTMLGGIPGLLDLANDADLSAIYANMTETVKNMTVNDEIFIAILQTLTADDEAFIELEETLYNMAPQIDATYESVLDELDDTDEASPASINFYAKDFESKEKIVAFIDEYNGKVGEKDQIEYTDIVGALMSSVTIIVNAISYVLIAFVAISLIVSSIMIGIITNISVLERTKEIGILRAVGASKKDVSRVFNAETLIIGLAAGALGIIITLLLCIPITAILQFFTGLDNIRVMLPWAGAVILVLISMTLTLIAGLIPSRSAAKKDPVIALRSE